MAHSMNDERWESILGYLKETVKLPAKTPDNVLVLALSKDELTQIFTKKRIELIETIQKGKPSSLSSLAHSLKRVLPAVERDLKILERHGVVELKKTGRTVKPVVEKEVIVLPLLRPLPLKQRRQ